MGGGVALEVVGQERADGPLDHSLGEDLAELLREKGGGYVLGRFGINGNGLDLWVDASGEVSSDDGVFPLKLLQGEVAGAAEPSAWVLAQIDAAKLFRAWGAVEKEPGLASPAGDAQAGAGGGLMEEVLLGLGGSEGGDAGFCKSEFHGSGGRRGAGSGVKIGNRTGLD